MLSESEIEQYHRDGYVVPDYRLPPAVLDAIDRKVCEFLEAHPEYRDNCPALLREDLAFADFCRAPGLLDMSAQLIGPDIALWNMSLFGKPAGNGKATPWHQDGEYWPIRPLATCTVWIAVDDSTRENGCLEVIPGSHRSRALARHRHNEDPGYTLFEELEPEEFDPADGVGIELARGQISLHDVFLYHGSQPNRSSKPRRGMTMRLMPTTSLYDREAATRIYERNGRINLGGHPVLLLRGEDRHGGNDFFCRAH